MYYNDRLNNIQSGFNIAVTTGLIILLLIRSGPDALFGSNYVLSLISSSVTFIFSNTSCVCSIKGGNSAFVSSGEETEAK